MNLEFKMHSQTSLFGDGVRPGSGIEDDESIIYDKAMIETLEADLDAEAEYSDSLFNYLAVSVDMLGKLVVGLNQQDNQAAMPTLQQALDSVDEHFPAMTKIEKDALCLAIKFHFHAESRTRSSTPEQINWRDTYPLTDLQKVNFDNVINSYYSPKSDQ